MRSPGQTDETFAAVGLKAACWPAGRPKPACIGTAEFLILKRLSGLNVELLKAKARAPEGSSLAAQPAGRDSGVASARTLSGSTD